MSRREEMSDQPATEFFEGWPNQFKTICGWAFTGISNAYPLIVWSWGNEQPYLVPDSIFCPASRLRLTKAQRARTSHHVGGKVYAIVHKNEKNEGDYIVRALFSAPKNHSLEFNESEQQFKVDCVISPDPIMRQCYSREFGVCPISKGAAGISTIGNICYQGFISSRIVTKDNSTPTPDNIGMWEVRLELARIIMVKPRGQDYPGEHLALINECPWNIRKRGMLELPTTTTPKPPQIYIPDVLLCYFEDNRVIRPKCPKTLVKIPMGMDKKMANCIHKGKTALKEGQFVRAMIVYSSVLGCYYVESHVVPNEEWKKLPNVRSGVHSCSPLKYMHLEKRTIIEDGSPVNEYLVRARESCMFKGFYTCDPLDYCLIADPRAILRNVRLENHREDGGSPVWIRLEKDHKRLAKFTIWELYKESGEYTRQEKMMEHPNIVGSALLVDFDTGTVFCADYPQTDIRLNDVNKYKVQLGHHFYFCAVYWPERKFYLICSIQPISTTQKPPVETFRVGRGIYFRDSLKCYCIQTDETHISPIFGPVIDPMEVVSKKARRDQVDWPTDAEGFVCFNPDWVPGADTQMLFHGYDLDEGEAENVTGHLLIRPPPKDEDAKCRCYKLWHLLYDVREKTKGILNEEKWNELDKMVEENKNNPMISGR